MNWLSFLLAGVLVYVAVAVFLVGTVFRVYYWLKVPRSSIRLGIFPQANSQRGRFLQWARDTFLFLQVLDVDRPMWLFVILLHIGGLAAFVGHLRLIQEFTPLATALGKEGMGQFSLISGGIVGIVLLVSVIYLLSRRFKSPYRDLSTPEDYFLLILIFMVLLMGNHLRFFGHVEVEAYRAYVHSLLTFSPEFPVELAESGTRWVLVTHVTLSNLLLIYLPFSKLVHYIGTYAVNLVRSEAR
ncbi:MAG: respiratory nitrate reductase subunit gamma [Dehalococcoidales bacterium]|nr:MAG: respiratory nitrate reductase subunit gamma [Dehalococcoidales bacterium]